MDYRGECCISLATSASDRTRLALPCFAGLTHSLIHDLVKFCFEFSSRAFSE